MSDNVLRILLVEDEPDHAKLTKQLLLGLDPSKFVGSEAERVEVLAAATQDQVDAALNGTTVFDLVILDLKYPGPGRTSVDEDRYQGLEWLQRTRGVPQTPVVVFTAFPFDNELNNAVTAIIEGWAVDFIPKTAEWSEIERRLQIGYARGIARREFRSAILSSWELIRTQVLRTHVEDIIGIVNRAQTWFYSVAKDLEGGEPERVRKAPDLIRGSYNSLRSEVLREAKRLDVYPEREPEEIELFGWLERLRGAYAIFFREIGAHLELKRDIKGIPLPPVEIETFPSDLRIVIHELLLNARDGIERSKTPPGKRIALITVAPIDGRVRITVADNGCGLAEEDTLHLFEPGYRGHRNAQNDARHHGMGLYVVKRTMPILGGSIHIANREKGVKGVDATIEIENLRRP